MALIGIWAYNAPAIADVVKETSSRDKYIVATFDAQDLAIAAMEQGQDRRDGRAEPVRHGRADRAAS